MSVSSMNAICSSTPARSSSGRPRRPLLAARRDAPATPRATRSYMRTAVALSIATNIALPRKPRPTKWRTRSAAIRSQPLRPGDQLVLGREAARAAPAPAESSSSACLEDPGELLVEALVDDLQLGDPVLVEERDRRAVLDRVAEVVGRDVVAEDLARALDLARDQRRAREAEEARVRQRRRMLSASVEYWLRCASSVITITSSRSEQTGISSPCSGRNLWIRVKT